MTISLGAAELADRVVDVVGRVAVFRELAPVAATVGAPFPDATTIDRSIDFLTDLDIPRILRDLDAVVGAHQDYVVATDMVAARPISTSWRGGAGGAASAAVDSQLLDRDTELATLTAAAAAATPALAGLKLLLQNVFQALEQASEPTLVGHALPSVPAALSAGALRSAVVADEIAARVRLFTTATAIGRRGVRDILAELVGIDVTMSSGELALAGDQ
ncbi:hypothetical protein [Gordonia sp. CPCC 205333]|uniref:hypothetical protein n=1 Tax=Gordonia sp. CPCC 205333 TaxID=3140790 RepID=UPI003AF38D93